MKKGRLWIAPLMPPEETQAWVTVADWAQAQPFGAHRRQEFLSWRALLSRELGAVVTIRYDALGAPQLVDYPGFISVSHSATHVAVCWSESRCAVDIESLSRRFSKVKSRYMTPVEALLSEDPRLAAVVWSAKECLYKISGQEGLDLLCDLHVDAVDFEHSVICGRIRQEASIEMDFSFFDGDIVVSILS
ncbi:MAG: 4'-phosphopantetheinyl transferase superfamily protein [Alistipes sp.]